MKIELLNFLRCPISHQILTVNGAVYLGDDIHSGWLISADGMHKYRIYNGIPRFVPESNYADNFGMQWNYFRQTQLDSYSGHTISAD